MPRDLPILVPPEQWRHLLRALLRECSYLPDPIARKYMHDHVMTRYREYAAKYKENLRRSREQPSLPPPKALGIIRQARLRRAAKQTLSLLTRANEGYPKPLERVLLLAYGRIGRRRHRLLEAMLESEEQQVPPNTEAVKEMLKRPAKFEDGWKPPAILVELLKAQHHSPIVVQSNVRSTLKTFEPKIAAENSWGRPMPLCRRRNIRARWYAAALNSALPPLPEYDMTMLRGLLDGTQPWAPRQRRKAPAAAQPASSSSLDARFLAEGPKKGVTFRQFTDGRPHKITLRLMQRLWDRINCLIPRVTHPPERNHKLTFEFPMPRHGKRAGAIAVNEQQVPDLFGGLDERGRKVVEVQAPKPMKDVHMNVT
ncbi:hypothetical protein VTN77DRAFT_6951 [Rasamsonia byssochlamydoides]|uniref:uncharacterized protein n=1 Tax=Rasamsonia byssochlamydoides TaxID=89139 RepID=UPI0037442983